MPAAATTRKLVLLGSLYLAQGLPDGFFRQALPVMLRGLGLSLENIGLAALLALPWAFKFMWAPLVDGFGRRRSWIIPLQLVAIVTFLLLSQADPRNGLTPLLIGVLLINFLAATQDIATDGLAVALLQPGERGLGNGVQVAAYRLGMIISGGALIILHEQIGWATTFYVLAGVCALALVPVLRSQEPEAPAQAPASPRVFAELLRQPGMASWLLVIASYKFGEAFGVAMLRPMLVDRHLGLTDLGWITGTAGFIASLVGAMVGGALVGRFGRYRMLLVGGVVQALAVISYAALALGPLEIVRVYVVCSCEHFSSGLATVPLFTMMMDATRPHAAGTDYTAQACVVVLATIVASSLSGFSAGPLGYPAHFAVAAGLCLLGLLPALAHRARVRRGATQLADLS